MAKSNTAKSKKSSAKKGSRGGKSGKLVKVFSIILLLVLVVFVVAYIGQNIIQSQSTPTLAQKTALEKPGERKVQSTSNKKSGKKTQKKDKKQKADKPESKKAESKKSKASKSETAKAEASKLDTKLSPAVTLPVGTLSSLVPERDLHPTIEFSFKSQLIEHKGFVVSYNADYKVPNWVLYELNMAETMGTLKRSNNFAPDPMVPEKQMAQLSDYRNSGFDRGHMAPNADLNWDVKAQDECYYLSNMCPQTHEFNAGIWLDLENSVRKWAERDSAITIVCGPVLPRSSVEAKKMRKIGKGHVLVPEYFYKVILSPYGKRVEAIAFLFPHDVEKGGRKKLQDYVVSVDDIETLTGLDFFPKLPDNVEDKIESTSNLKYWFK